MDFGLEPPDLVRIQFIFHSGAACTGVPIGAGAAQSGPSVAWAALQLSLAIPAGAPSVSFAVIGASDSPDTFFVAFDRAYLGFAPRVFADDFEAEQLCRWSSSAL